MSIQDILEQTRKRNEDDAKRFEALDHDLCMLCHAHGADKRSLIISCGYDVSEAVPDAISLRLVEGLEERGWYLRICKSCRAALLGALAEWWNGRIPLRSVPKNHDGYLVSERIDACIPVRQHGAITMMTPPEWEQYREDTDAPE